MDDYFIVSWFLFILIAYLFVSFFIMKAFYRKREIFGVIISFFLGMGFLVLYISSFPF